MTDIIKRFTVLFVYLVIVTLLVSCPKPAEGDTDIDSVAVADQVDDLYSLTVLHTNDVHGRVMQFNSHGSTCKEEEAAEGECFGGVARRATMILRNKEGQTNLLLLDAGDQFQGTLFYTQYKGKAAQTFMNKLRYDAMTLGNHEFDDGDAVLAEFISGLRFPVVSANIDVENEPLLQDLITPYEIIEIDGRRIGITGYTTEETDFISKPGPNIVFNDIESSVQDIVSELQDQGVDIIIALSHAGLGRDQEIASAIEGIDIIVGAHTHSLLSNTDEEAEGPYPVLVDSPAGEPVLVVTTKGWGQYLGKLEVGFDADGVALEWSGEPILLDSSVPEDEEILAEVLEMNMTVEPLTWLVIGETEVELIGVEEIARHEECNLANLINDALLWETRESGVQVALFNGGGIRSGIAAGEITFANVLEVMPFGDTLATLKLTGEHLREVLEFGVSRAEDPLNEGTGRFLHAGGLSYTWNPNEPVGSRITWVEIHNPDGSVTPLVDSDTYKIAVSDYLRHGHDGFDILRDEAIDPYDFGRVMSDIVVDYIREFSPVNPQVGGRINRTQ